MTSDAGGSPRRSIRYLFAALAIALVVIPAFLLLAFALQDELAHLFFGDASRYALILPTSLVVVGLYLHTVTYGYLMGHLAVVPANLLQIVNTGAIPAVAVLLAGDAATALVILGAATIAASLVAIFIALYIDRRELRTRAIKTPALELLRFGLPRVPGEFALYGLFAIPTFVVAHRFDIETAGYFSFGLSLVQLIGTPFGAVNMVLLPTVSSLVARHSWQRISDFMWRFVLGTAAIAIVGVALAEFIFASPARSPLGPGLG